MQDNNGQTPLHFAAKFGHQQIVANIISWCKQTINISDKQKVTPFVQAVVSGHFDVSLFRCEFEKSINKKNQFIDCE